MPAARAIATPAALARLGTWHRLGERQLEALREPLDPGLAEAALRYFDLTESQHHRDEEDDLLPALIESMAGSDPVCLRELAAAAITAHRAIESAWRALRPQVLAVARGEPAVLSASAVDALAERCRASFALEDREILPMAARLLDHPTLQDLARRFDARRAAPIRR